MAHFLTTNQHCTICVVSHADNAFYLKRNLTKLFQHTNVERFHLRIGLNGAGDQSIRIARSAVREFGNVSIHSEPRNIYKSPLMAKLFAMRPITTAWVIWFDDDSYPYRSDWLPGLQLKMEAHPDVDVWGNPFFIEADSATERFIRSSSWYRGIPFDYLKPDLERSESPVLTFVAGGFWAAKTKVLNALDWPDPRLIQHEDDFIFGEALRQNGFQIGRYRSGVRISDAERRCPSNTPCSYDSLAVPA